MFKKSQAWVLLTLLSLFFLIGTNFNQNSLQDEIERLNLEIKIQGLEWEAGETSISRLPLEERRMRLGAIKPVGEDYENLAEVKIRSTLPSSLDWRSRNGRNYMTTIKDQGNCGSCWAFSVLGTMEAVYNIENNIFLVGNLLRGTNFVRRENEGSFLEEVSADYLGWISGNSLKFPDFSEQDLISCSQAGDCDGGWGWKAATHVRNQGVVSEDCFPYLGRNAPCTRCSNWREKLATIQGWGWVTQAFEDRNRIKNALQDGPLSFFMDVYSDFYYYRRGVYEPTFSATYEGGHLVVLVGYDDSQGCWICKNSWGSAWGEDGYFRIRRGVCSGGQYVMRLWGVSIKNHPPVLQTIGNQTIKEGQEFTLNLHASDPDGDELFFNAFPLPQGSSFDSHNGVFNWTPSYIQDGEYRIRFSVSDGLQEDFEDITITVLNVKRGKAKI